LQLVVAGNGIQLGVAQVRVPPEILQQRLLIQVYLGL
jgi:hypothetical protein